jgi:acyl transferase domain-containing protein/NADP-dependent 3-hydroxy acid dehydrogenase YdfG/acyl carrier protein
VEPIAIIGIGCRFPGAENPEAFWQLLRDGVDAITDVPSDRWDIDEFYHPEPGTPGKMYTRRGGFIQQLDQFDPTFFGISPREAERIDPQQRLVLEVAWEALENAGVVPSQLSGSQTGVFIGIGNFDFSLLRSNGEMDQLTAYDGTGSALGIAANRLSYLLNLRGPSLTTETACSSSLVATHLACRSLQTGESNMAIVGAVSLLMSPAQTVTYSQARMMSPDGRCKTFDASADGYVRGEGCGIVILKRLADAVRDGDPIQAVIRGSAINQDGLTNGITAPNGPSQQAVIQQALANAGVKANDISYIEAHGTGTALGDPIEVKSLKSVLMPGRTEEQTCWLGSVKTNIGHLEVAAGMAGLIKVVLALKHQQIPESLHFNQLNPLIPFKGTTFKIPTQLQSWDAHTETRLAGLSSFGFGGTNAHIIIEQAPSQQPPTTAAPVASNAVARRPAHLLTLSAKTPAALQQLAKAYQNHLAQYPEQDWSDICFNTNVGRSPFKHRLTVIADSRANALTALTAAAQGEEAAGLAIAHSARQAKVAFLFTGQGSQYAGMAQQLYETEPVFRAALDQCQAILQPQLATPLLSVIYPADGDASLINQTAYTQPALFAVEYSLCKLWQSWGIAPTLVMGHSVGEYVAACIAGVFSLEDALTLIAARARLMQALPQNGSMVALMAEPERVKQIIAPYGDKVAIAAINGPTSVVISGEREAIDSVCQTLATQGVKTKPLQVSHAFHSPLMQPMMAEFRQVATRITYATPKIAIISNLTGELVTSEIATPDYWCQHILQPVLFAASMATLSQQRCNILLEVGPKPILLGMGRQCLPEDEQRLWLPSLRPGIEDWQTLLSSLATLYRTGANVDWVGFDQSQARQRQALMLPTYPFQRERYWASNLKPAQRSSAALWQPDDRTHPLLGQRLPLADSPSIYFQSPLSQSWPQFLQDHQICGAVILPATAYMEMALAAAKNVFQDEQVELQQVSIQQALILGETDSKVLQTVLKPSGDDTSYSFQILSANASETAAANWTVHATGQVSRSVAGVTPEPIDLAALQATAQEPIVAADYYHSFRQRGFDYGPYFQGVNQIWRTSSQPFGQIELPGDLAADAYQLHPALLDACLQVLGAAFPQNGADNLYLPVGVETLRIYQHAAHTRVWCQIQRLQAKDANQNSLSADLLLLDGEGRVVAQLSGFSLRRITQKAFNRALQKAVPQPPAPEKENTADWLYDVAWQPQPLPTTAPSSGTGSWLILADTQGIGHQLATHLQAQGDRTVIVTAGSSYQVLGEHQYQINPTQPEDFQRLLAASLHPEMPAYRGIVHLSSLDSATLTTDATSITALQTAQQQLCGSVLHLLQALVQHSGNKFLPDLWLVTRGAQAIGQDSLPLQVQQSTLWGLGRVIALEHQNLTCRRLDLDPAATEATEALLAELIANDREDQIAYREGVRHVARLVRHTAPEAETTAALTIPSEPFQLKISEYGVLENLTLKPMARRPVEPNEVEIQVRAVGLNFRDVLNALGMLKTYTEQLGITDVNDLPFGGECAGIVVAVGAQVSHLKVGDAVLATHAIGSLSSYVTVASEFVALKPENLSFEAAATVPTAFLTAHYGLQHKANLQAGDRVLIHAAAGGVGQAAVQLAQQAGATVLATASPSKWPTLQAAGVEHVMNSRNLEFTQQVLDITNGSGVDVVLNSLNGDFIPKSLEALAAGGRFVEIGKIGVWEPEQVAAQRPDAQYFPFDLLNISLENPGFVASMLEHLMGEFRQAHLQPLPHTVFALQDVVNAFRFMAQAKHIGKVVVTIPDPASAPTASNQMVKADRSYLITGGLGALGIQTAQWLVQQGARHLVLTGRRAPSETVQGKIQALEQTGAKVQVATADIAERRDLEQVFQTLPAPLGGVIHAAGVLEDGLLIGQEWDSFERVMAPKVTGAWHLHSLTAHLNLDFFVCFSSVAAMLGSPGQGNYAAANAFMDALVHHRRRLGLPGSSINWGPWAEAGMAAALGSREQARWAAQGIKPIALEPGFQVLGELLSQKATQVGVLPINWSQFISQFPPDKQFPLLEVVTATANAVTQPKSAFRQKLEAAALGDRRALLLEHLCQQIAKVLDMPSAAAIDPQLGFTDLGMDSLMAVELSNRLRTSLDCPVSAAIAFDYPTIEALADYFDETIAKQLANAATTAVSPTVSAGATAPLPTRPSPTALSGNRIPDYKFPDASPNPQRVKPQRPGVHPLVSPPPISRMALAELSESEAEALLISQLEAMRY